MYEIQRTTQFDDLWANSRHWNSLARGVPLREMAWIQPWWSCFGSDCEPYILVARDDSGRICGILPLYRRSDSPRILRHLGDNRVCTDFVSILARSENAEIVARSMAKFLMAQTHQRVSDVQGGWDQIALEGVCENDPVMRTLAASMQASGGVVHAHSRMHTWYRPCEGSWDDMLGRLSRSSRRQIRAFEKRLTSTDGLRHRFPENKAEVSNYIENLIHLHQKRWNEAGEPGSYEEPRLRAFIHKVALQMYDCGSLYLPMLQLNSSFIGGELGFVGNDQNVYIYSTGYDSKYAKLQPGSMLAAKTLRFAYDNGLKGVELMRGDEPYKAKFNGVPSRLLEVRIVAPSWRAKASHTAWTAQFEIKQWARRSAGRALAEVVAL